MQHILGVTLEDLWFSLSQGRKDQICRLISQNVLKMRQAPSPERYCSLAGRPLRHDFFRTNDILNDGWKYHGPFRTEQLLNDFIFREHLGFSARDHRSCKAEFLAQHAAACLLLHEPVLTHGDLQRSNIQVQLRLDLSVDSVKFLDRECAGWYTSYWEYVMTLRGCKHFLDDWLQHVNKILENFPQEWVWMRTVMEAKW